MKNWKKFSGAGGLAMLLSTTAAFADVSNRDVWDAWKGAMTDVGYAVSGSESESGGVLTVSDLVMSFDMAPEEGDVRIDMGELRFEEQGDGTVRIFMQESIPMQVNVTEEGETSDITVLMNTNQSDIVASGAVDDITFTYSASGIDILLDSLIVDGAPVDNVEFKAQAMGVAGQSSLAQGETMSMSQNASVNSLSFIAKGEDPEEGAFDVKADIIGMAFDVSGFVTDTGEDVDPAKLLRDGSKMDGRFSSEGSTVVVSADEGTGPTNINMTTGKSELLIRASEGEFEYDGGVKDLALNMLSPDLPLPVVLNMGEFSYGFLMPLLKGDTPQSFDASFKLADLTVSDMLWGIFDPGAMLPRDPATLSMAVTGTATLFEDLLSEEIEESEEIPGEVNSLTLSEIVIDMVGASISGDGAFTFDNTDMETFDGFPRPTGAINLQAKGINGLLDTLVSMGLLPEEQVMGARMMMAMFTVPGEGEDEMSSTIEVNEAGHVLANGQRIQ